MTALQRNALGRLPLPEAEVELLYLRVRSGEYGSGFRAFPPNELKTLLESHTRLQIELQGAEVLIAENRAIAGELLAFFDQHEPCDWRSEVVEMLRKLAQ